MRRVFGLRRPLAHCRKPLLKIHRALRRATLLRRTSREQKILQEPGASTSTTATTRAKSCNKPAALKMAVKEAGAVVAEWAAGGPGAEDAAVMADAERVAAKATPIARKCNSSSSPRSS